MHIRGNRRGPAARIQRQLETYLMNRKLIALIVLFVAMILLARNIERSARPVADRQAGIAGESHEGHDH
jgi:hypothetical protein